MNALDILKMGYTDLVPVIPPGAPLSPYSKIRPEDRGKVPGVMNGDGTWHGINWRALSPTTESDVARWGHMGANIGLRAAYYPAVDVDCTDPALASVIEKMALLHLGPAPKRVGRAPKALLIYRTSQPFGRMRLWIDSHLIEVLGDGQQYVVAGTHPATGKPYEWPRALIGAHDLVEITRDDAEAFLTACQEAVDALGYTCRREGHGGLAVDRESIDQEALAGDFERVKAALALIPNDNEHFPGRDDYLRMGYAIKAALGEAGYPLFEEWALKWEGNDQFDGNDPEIVRADWERMKPPYEVGAPWIFETATEFGYDWAADEFEAEADLPDDADSGEFTTEENVPEGGEKDGGAPIEYSDAALASRLLKRHAADIRHCEAIGGWLTWDGKRWNRAGDKTVRHWAARICKQASGQALDRISDPKKAESVATRLASNATKNAVVAYAADHPAVSVELDQLDADPWLLNTPGGVVDLRTGELRPHDPELLMTRLTAVAPASGDAPIWREFLRVATGGDVELERYLQRLAGYSLTAVTQEQQLTFMWGPGGNGKGTFLNTISDIWADYAKAAPMEMFTTSKTERHPTELADLAGARLVTAQETQEGRRWDEQKVKALTGGDKVKARFMREDFFEFTPTFKLVFAGNHKPEIRNLDDAIQRRFHLVPFTVKPPKKDPLLHDKLRAEWPQILQWAIEGCLMWQREGLNPPKLVVDATTEYFDDEDPIGQWLRERVAEDGGAGFTPSSDFYDDYREWCGVNGEYARSHKALTQILVSRGFRRVRQGGTGARGFKGVRLLRQQGDEFPTV
ncbi:MAG: phage/plasmid primase, P4 family [Burkholderia multivorans]|nr:phage/plasmid primase, P4 family [Burkholderia multivorans]